MTSKVVLSVAGAAIIGASAFGMQLSKNAVQQQINKLSMKLNGTEAIAFEINTVSGNFFTEQHKITLFFDTDPVEFTQNVTFLPWGAKANIQMVQESEFFVELRNNTTFTELPLNIDWEVNGLAQTVILNADLAPFEVTSTQQDNNFKLTGKPAFMQITSDLEGANTKVRTAIQGYTITSDEFDLALTSLTMDGTSKAAMGMPLISDTVMRLADVKVTSHDQSDAFKSFQLSRLSYTVTSDFAEQTFSFDSNVKIGDIIVKHAPTSPTIAEHVSLENIGFNIGMDNMSLAFITRLKAFNELQQRGHTPTQDDINKLGDAFFSESKQIDFGLSTDNLNFTLNGQQSSGAINLTGKGETPPTDFQQVLQFGPQVMLGGMSGELDVSIARSLVDFGSQLTGMPYQPFLEQGFLEDANNQISTHVEYKNGVLTANGKDLGL